MRRAAVTCALVLLLAGCDGLPGKPTPDEKPLRPEQVVDFDQLYGDNCSGCHGADGTFGAARPLNDALYLALAGADRLRQIVASGVPDSLMPGFAIAAGGVLTDQQIGIIVDGMQSRWGGGNPLSGLTSVPPYAAPPGDAQRGFATYVAYCASCHGADGAGGDKGGSIVDRSYLQLVSDQALRSAVLAGRRDLGMPDWRNDGRPLSDRDIADVVAWMMSKRTAQ